MNDLGKKIKQLRESKNLTQKELGEATGLSTRSIQNYELGLRKPNFNAITEICNYFDIPISYLTENYTKLDDVPREAVLIYNELVRLGFKEPDKLLDDATTQKLINFIKENKEMIIEYVKKNR